MTMVGLYENWVTEMLTVWAHPEDVLVQNKAAGVVTWARQFDWVMLLQSKFHWWLFHFGVQFKVLVVIFQVFYSIGTEIALLYKVG